MFSKNYLTFPVYVFRSVRLLKNWNIYLYNHILRKQNKAVYHFRNGVILQDWAGTLPGTIAEVFLRNEYGKIDSYDTIVDIGANMGAFSIFAALQNPDARIFSYEPESHNYSMLRSNISNNNLNNRIVTHNIAVAGDKGAREFYKNESPINSLIINNNATDTVFVSCITLSDVIESNKIDKIDLLKLNCEGAEYEILYNCDSETFIRIKAIRLEYHNVDNSLKNGRHIRKFLEGCGYEIERYSRYKNVSGFIWARR